jgi:hypothetical protein
VLQAFPEVLVLVGQDQEVLLVLAAFLVEPEVLVLEDQDREVPQA